MPLPVRPTHVVAFLASSLLAVASLQGCGSRSSDPNTGANQGGNNFGTPEGGYATTNTGAPPPATTTAPPPATTTAPPPATTTAPTTTTATPPPFDPTPLAVLLTPLAQQHAPGAKAEGPPLAGFVQQGQSLQQNVTLQPSGTKCYTVIAVGLPPITDLFIELVGNPPPPLPPMTMAQSSGGGAQPVLAGKPNCFKNLLPVPAPAILKVTARTGSGGVLAQLYAKLDQLSAFSDQLSAFSDQPYLLWLRAEGCPLKADLTSRR